MASGLGRSLRLLKRHPYAILLVSNADRIARRTDVFTLIQKQGLGHRVFDADTGMHVNDIIKAGIHRQIETKTEELHAARQEGLKDYQASGGKLGSSVINTYAQKATLKKQHLARERSDAILRVVRKNVLNTRGRVPSYHEICTELNRREIRTGQGRFFTQGRLIQWRKNHLTEWRKAIDSYAAPRRRIRWLIRMIQSDIRNRRDRKLARRKLTRDVDCDANDMRQSSLWSPPSFSLPMWSKERLCRYRCRDQCRGPPWRWRLHRPQLRVLKMASHVRCYRLLAGMVLYRVATDIPKADAISAAGTSLMNISLAEAICTSVIFFGRPPRRPRRLAAASPILVRSINTSRSS